MAKLDEFYHKSILIILSLYTSTNLLSISEIDLAQCPLEWNHASVYEGQKSDFCWNE